MLGGGAGRTADPALVRLFAMLHDCQRWDEGADLDHGPRAAAFARQLPGDAMDLDDARLGLLEEAIALHARGYRSDHPTVGTCWDADRLDLPRAGIWPSADRLSTAAARQRLRASGTSDAGRRR